jgi:uncharacterized membrane protein YGL010W
MHHFFRQQLATYADHHRDARNCTMHMIGIPILFLATALPLNLWSIDVFDVQVSSAFLLALPPLAVWILLDLAVGLTVLLAVLPLLLGAAMIASLADAAAVWIITTLLVVVGAALQIAGHAMFEHRRPALLDNPAHMLIGPMFIVSKMFVALGRRPDLAAIIESGPLKVFDASATHMPI